MRCIDKIAAAAAAAAAAATAASTAAIHIDPILPIHQNVQFNVCGRTRSMDISSR
jgi:polyisoprenoid-binding protein YceI